MTALGWDGLMPHQQQMPIMNSLLRNNMGAVMQNSCPLCGTPCNPGMNGGLSNQQAPQQPQQNEGSAIGKTIEAALELAPLVLSLL